MSRTLLLGGMFLLLGLVAMGQPDEIPERLRWETDWVQWKDAMAKPEGVTKIIIKEMDKFDYSQLDTFPELQGLIILETPIKDFTFLAHHPHLKVLEVHSNYLKSIKGIEQVPGLLELGINYNFVKDISPLDSLTQLTYLKLYDNEITNIAPLANMKSLLTLDLGKNPVVDLEPIREAKDLRYLGLFKCYEIRSLGFVRDLRFLTDLNISFTETEDFSLAMVSGLKDLENLRIQGIVKNDDELSHIQDLVKLKQLTMGRNDGITDISMLDKLVAMEYLDIHSNNVSDISVVTNYPNLIKLVMYRNKVTDISPLREHPELRALFINENPIEDYSVLFELTQLQYLDMDDKAMTLEQKKMLRSLLKECQIGFL